MIKSAKSYFSLVYDRLHKFIYNSKIIHADETPVKIMRIENNKIKNCKRTYMWVYRNNTHCSEHPIVIYDWQLSRKANHPMDFLKDFSGTVVTDGYQVYHNLIKKRHNLQIAGCWIHARRPFTEFIKSVGSEEAKGSITAEAYSLITEIMHIDNTFDDLSNRNHQNHCQLELQSKVDAFFE